MTEPLFPLPVPDLTVLVQPVAALFAAYGAVKIAPPLIRRARQRAYDEASEAEIVRLTISPPPGLDPDPELAVELVRALHPRQRRGVDAWRIGWPSVELDVVHRRGELVWEVVANRQVAVLAENAIRSICPGAAVDVGQRTARPVSAVAVARFASPGTWPLREPERPEARVLHRLAGGLESAPAEADIRLRIICRPVAPEDWRKVTEERAPNASPTIGQLVGAAIVDGLLFHESRYDDRSSSAAPTVSPEEREARKRKRRGVVGFDVGLVLEVAGVSPDRAEALLWRLVDFTHPLGDGRQEIRWEIRRGATTSPPRARLADWELASSGIYPTRRSTRLASSAIDRWPRARQPTAQASSGSSSPMLVVDRSRSRLGSCRATSSPSARPARARARSC